MELDLVAYKGSGGISPWLKKSQERCALGRKQFVAASQAPNRLPKCMPIMFFCCGQEDHQAAICPVPTAQMVTVIPNPSKLKKPPKTGKEKLRTVTQVIEDSPPESGGEWNSD